MEMTTILKSSSSFNLIFRVTRILFNGVSQKGDPRAVIIRTNGNTSISAPNQVLSASRILSKYFPNQSTDTRHESLGKTLAEKPKTKTSSS